MPARGPDFQSVPKGHLVAETRAAAVANVVAAAVNTIFSLIHTPVQVTAGGIFISNFRLEYWSDGVMDKK
jgi:hypothetical protein